MDTENNHEGNHLKLRIAIGKSLIAVGSVLTALGGVMYSLQPEPAPWWAIALIVIGILILVVGLLIVIVPPKKWRGIWYKIRRLPGWLKEKCIQIIFYGWKYYVIDKPIFIQGEIDKIAVDHCERKITAKFRLAVKARGKPITIELNPWVFIEQRMEWGRTLQLRLDKYQGTHKIEVKSNREWSDIICVSGIYRGEAVYVPDINREKIWGTRGITLILYNGIRIPLSKGDKYKPKVAVIG